MTYKTPEELETLSLYGAKDFRSISKEKLMTFTSTLHEMDADVAKAIVSQNPEYFDTCKQMSAAAISAFEKELESGDKKFQATYAALDEYQKYLGDCLEKAQTDEARLAILKQMGELTDKYMEIREHAAKETHDSFNKVILTILAIACLAGTAMGISSNLGKRKRH